MLDLNPNPPPPPLLVGLIPIKAAFITGVAKHNTYQLFYLSRVEQEIELTNLRIKTSNAIMYHASKKKIQKKTIKKRRKKEENIDTTAKLAFTNFAAFSAANVHKLSIVMTVAINKSIGIT